MRTLYKDYCEIVDEVWLRFNQKDKSEHDWYYRRIGGRDTLRKVILPDTLKEIEDYAFIYFDALPAPIR